MREIDSTIEVKKEKYKTSVCSITASVTVSKIVGWEFESLQARRYTGANAKAASGTPNPAG